MALVGNTMKRSKDFLVNLKVLLSELLCYAKGSQFYWWRISNDIEGVKKPLSILVYGREMIADDVVATFFYNRDFKKDQLAQCKSRKAFGTIDAYQEDRDALIIMETPSWRQSSHKNTTLFQTLLDTTLNINGRSYEEVLKQEMSRRYRKRLSQSLESCPGVRTTKNIEDILRSRKDLLIPFAQTFHGEQSNIPTEEELRALAEKLLLFYMKEDDKTVAVGLSIFSNRTSNIWMWLLGMTEELRNNSHLKSQCHLAFFASMLQFGCEMGLSSVSDGLTSPVMTHGNLAYKMRLSCIPVILPHYPMCTIRFCADNLPEILEEHPLLVVRDDVLAGMIGLGQNFSPGDAAAHLNTLFKAHTYHGLKNIDCVVYTDWFNEQNEKTMKQLELYDLSGIEKNGQQTIVSFTRRHDS